MARRGGGERKPPPPTSGISISTYRMTLNLGPKNSPWQKETIDNVIALVNCLMCKLES